jgi:hypothetical protein
MLGKRFTRALAVTSIASLVMAAATFADTVSNNVDGTVDADLEVLNLTAGGSAGSVILRYIETNDDSKNGCNLTGSNSQLNIGVASSNTAVATVNLSALNFSACGQAYTISVTPVGTGSATVSATFTNVTTTQGDVDAADFNLLPASFSVNVVAAPVTDGQAPQSAAISINDGAGWTNSLTASLDISATDNVGVTGYRLATTQAGLDSASTVAVTSATSFAATDLPFTLTGPDGTNSAWVRFFDAAGNSSDATDTIGLDRVQPTITAETNGYTPGTWTNQDVDVDFTCADNVGGSGIAINTVAGSTVSTEGADQSVSNTGSCIDNAGNPGESVTVADIDIDKTKPSIAISSPATGTTTFLASVTVQGTASDALSGLASTTVNGSAVAVMSGAFSDSVSLACGANTITAAAVDNAGNTESTDVTVTRVCFSNLRYYQPLDQTMAAGPVVVNSGKYGRVIPTKITILTEAGPVTDSVLADYGWSLKIGVNGVSCSGGAATDSLESYADAGSSNSGSPIFRWDPMAEQFIYNLDTKAPAGVSMTIGNCYRLDVYITDGTSSLKLSSDTYAIFKPVK